MGARFLAALARRLEAARAAHNSLACHNLVMVSVHAYLAGLMGPGIMYSLLDHLTCRCAPSMVWCIMFQAMLLAYHRLRLHSSTHNADMPSDNCCGH